MILIIIAKNSSPSEHSMLGVARALSPGLGLLYQGLDLDTEPDNLVRTKWTGYVRIP